MSVTEKNYKQLVNEFRENRTFYLGTQREKNLAYIKTEKRRNQVTFLDCTIEILEKDEMDITDATKKDILCGAMLTVLFEIKQEYQYRTPTHSELFNAISTTLAISDQTPPKAEDKRDCFKAALTFLEQQIYVEGNSEFGLQPEHAFSELNSNIHTIYKEINSLLAEARNEALERNIDLANAEPEAQYPPGVRPRREGVSARVLGGLSDFFGRSPTETASGSGVLSTSPATSSSESPGPL